MDSPLGEGLGVRVFELCQSISSLPLNETDRQTFTGDDCSMGKQLFAENCIAIFVITAFATPKEMSSSLSFRTETNFFQISGFLALAT